MFDGFCVLCYDKLDFNLDKGDMEVQNVANKSITYSSCEKNNVEDIKKRNIIKIVDYEKFSSQNPVFYQKLNNPDFILEALDNSGVLKYGKQNLYSLVQEKQNF